MIENQYPKTLDVLWEKVRQNIKKELSEQTFSTWITPVSIYSHDGNTVTLEVPNSFHSSWLREHYQDIITTSFALSLGENPTISFYVPPEEPSSKITTFPFIMEEKPSFVGPAIFTVVLIATMVVFYWFLTYTVGAPVAH